MATAQDDHDLASDTDSEHEVFFGRVTQREAKLIAKYGRRKTEVYYAGFRANMSVLSDSTDDSEVGDVGDDPKGDSRKEDEKCNDDIKEEENEIGNESPLCQKFLNMRMTSIEDDDDDDDVPVHVIAEDNVFVDDEVIVDDDNKIETLNDSLEVHRRRSLQSINIGASKDDSCVPETSMEEDSLVDDPPDEDSMRDPLLTQDDVEPVTNESDEYFTVPLHSSTFGASTDHVQQTEEHLVNLERTPSSESYGGKWQSVSYESHYVTAVQYLESIDIPQVSVSETGAIQSVKKANTEEHKIETAYRRPSAVMAMSVLDNVCQSCPAEEAHESFGEQNCLSGIQSLGSTHIFEDSLEKNLSIDEIKFAKPLARSTFYIQLNADTDPSKRLEDIQQPSLLDGNEATKKSVEEIRDVSCQTSFAFGNPAGDVAGVDPPHLPKKVEKMQCSAGVPMRSKFVAKSSQLPKPLKKPTNIAVVKSTPSVPFKSEVVFAKQLKNVKNSFRAPVACASIKNSAKLKYEHIRSPIAAYIRDDQSQPLIQNTRPKMARGINFGGSFKTRNAGGVQTRAETMQVKNNILKESHDNVAIPAAIVMEEGSKVKLETSVRQEIKEEENKAPFQQPLPLIMYNGSKAMIQKERDQLTKLHTVTNISTKIPSPRPPIVIKHTGQHKKIHWADHLASKGIKTFSPSRPTGIAPPILTKGVDYNNSVADGPNAVEVSIVEVMNAKRANTRV